MDLSIIDFKARPSEDEIKVLRELINNFGLDLSVMWCMIAAFNFGRIEEKRELRNEH